MRLWKHCAAAMLGGVSSFQFIIRNSNPSLCYRSSFFRNHCSAGLFSQNAQQRQATVSKTCCTARMMSQDSSTSPSDSLGNIITPTEGSNDESLSVYTTSYHAPVMWKECVDALLKRSHLEKRKKKKMDDSDLSDNISHESTDRPPLIFVDGTLGGGGHSAALLERLQPGDVVFGCDIDGDSLSTASKRLEKYISGEGEHLPLFVPVRANFCELSSVIPSIMHPRKKETNIVQSGVDGILLDLGVSSHQIDTAERGFAFMKEGPLDMRMGRGSTTGAGGLTAADICNEFDIGELQRIFKNYGDEPRSKAIAKSIVQRRPMMSTTELVEAVSAVTPEFVKKGRRLGRTATLARIFQSLRIVVNQEDLVLEGALTEMSPALIRPGGRLVVLSYHSMEDRATKRAMRDGTVNKSNRHNERDIYGNYIGIPKPFKTLGKPQKASPEEIETNSRARSATLRVAERLDS